MYVIAYILCALLAGPSIIYFAATKDSKKSGVTLSVINAVISAIILIIAPQFIFGMIRLGNLFDKESARAFSVVFIALVVAIIFIINLISIKSKSNIICSILICLTVFLPALGANTLYDKAASSHYEENTDLLASGREFTVAQNAKIYQRISTTEFRFPYTHMSSEWMPISFEEIEKGTVVRTRDDSIEWKDDEDYVFVISNNYQSGYVKTSDLVDYVDASSEQQLVVSRTYINASGSSFCFYDDMTCVYYDGNISVNGNYIYEPRDTSVILSKSRYIINLNSFSEPIYVQYEKNGRWTFSSPDDNWTLSEYYLQ